MHLRFVYRRERLQITFKSDFHHLVDTENEEKQSKNIGSYTESQAGMRLFSLSTGGRWSQGLTLLQAKGMEGHFPAKKYVWKMWGEKALKVLSYSIEGEIFTHRDFSKGHTG